MLASCGFVASNFEEDLSLRRIRQDEVALFQSAILLYNLRGNHFGIFGPSMSTSVSSGPWRWTPRGVEVDCAATFLPRVLSF